MYYGISLPKNNVLIFYLDVERVVAQHQRSARTCYEDYSPHQQGGDGPQAYGQYRKSQCRMNERILTFLSKFYFFLFWIF